MKVDFFICGVQKGGTTALDSLLRTHPDIQMARAKETHFFDNEEIDWLSPDYDIFHRQFDVESKQQKGDATPIYSYWPNAIERVHAYNPAAKLILLLRHPAHRALSHWRMETTRAAETLPFREAIREGGRRRVRGAPGGVHRVFSYVERGFYAGQIERIHRLFPADQILALRTDRLWSNTAETLSRIHLFLGVPSQIEVERRYIVPIQSVETHLVSEDSRYLSALYADDIHRTQQLSGLNLSDWLEPDYVEPMRAD